MHSSALPCISHGCRKDMFHVVIEPHKRQMTEVQLSEDNDYNEVFRDLPFDAECVEFSVGNPRVEHITGIVHLYKRNTATFSSQAAINAQASAKQGSNTQAASDWPDVSCTVCCLAIPADMSVAHFCTFIGAYLSEVRAIQVLRREGTQPSVCMVLLSFAAQEQADSFYNDFNGMPFSSLEPDIICRLVFVRSVEVLSARGRPTLTLPAAAGAAQNITAAAAKGEGSGKDKAAAGTSADANNSNAAEAPAGSATPTARTAAEAPSSVSSSLSTGKQAVCEIQPDEPEPAATANQSSTSGVARTARDSSISPCKGTDAQTTYAAVASGAAASGAGPSTPTAAAAAGPSTPTAGAGGCGTHAAAGGAVAVAASAAPCMLWLEPPPGTTELPTCPVCLERLDEHISGVVTTVCNHRFHGECLKRWGDTSCPVCRYCMYSSNASTSRCSTCGTNANLWICLICGHVGCGRYKQGHASDHWQESAHCYALELETQRVWDYAGDGYVHRLIQSKTDGKLVEVPSPAPTCSHGSPGHHHHRHHRHSQAARRLDRTSSECSGAAAGRGSAAGGGYGTGADSDSCGSASCPVCTHEQQQMKDALVSSKLDAITLEYNYLLTTQLDSQRQYFEGLLAQQEQKQRDAVAAAQAAAEQEAAARQAAQAAAKDSDRKRQQLEKKLSDLSGAVAKASEEREFLRSLNETLLANQKDFGSKLKTAQAALADKDAQLQDLQEQVRDLMVYIEAQRTIATEGGELQDATLLPVPAKASSGSGRRRSSKK